MAPNDPRESPKTQKAERGQGQAACRSRRRLWRRTLAPLGREYRLPLHSRQTAGPPGFLCKGECTRRLAPSPASPAAPSDVRSSSRRIFHRLLVKARLRRIRFHDLRHTFASRLIQNGESLAYVKKQMGHHSIKVTVDIYGKLVPGANKAAVDRLDAGEERVRMAQPSATPAQPGSRNRESAGPGRRLTPRIQMVELRGIEPLTPRLPASCSPS